MSPWVGTATVAFAVGPRFWWVPYLPSKKEFILGYATSLFLVTYTPRTLLKVSTVPVVLAICSLFSVVMVSTNLRPPTVPAPHRLRSTPHVGPLRLCASGWKEIEKVFPEVSLLKCAVCAFSYS